MPEKVSSVDGVVIATTYNDATAVAGGTDVTADVNGNVWGWLYVGAYAELAVDVTTVFTGGASPGATISIDRALADAPGTTPVFGSNVANAVATGAVTTSFSIGSGQATGKSFGRYIRVTWGTITGAPTAITIGVYVTGKF